MTVSLAGVVFLSLSSIALGQVAILQIRIVEGDGAIHAPGTRSSRPLIIEVADETGRPVPGAAISLHLPEEGPGGSFTNGLRTEVLVTDANGRAALRALHLNRQPGRFGIRLIASKEQARAGTVSFQYIAEPQGQPQPRSVAAAATPPRPAAAPGTSRSGKKWWVVAAAAGAAAAGGIVARGTGSQPPPGAGILSEALTLAPPPALSIGPPAISIGKP